MPLHSVLWVCLSQGAGARDALPLEVQRNTVAMELLCTDKAFCQGRKQDRTRFQVGGCVHSGTCGAVDTVVDAFPPWSILSFAR